MSRSHQRDDQEARERQMQQDIESAMSMCEWLSLLHTLDLEKRKYLLQWLDSAAEVCEVGADIT
jgi:hypothetical protein